MPLQLQDNSLLKKYGQFDPSGNITGFQNIPGSGPGEPNTYDLLRSEVSNIVGNQEIGKQLADYLNPANQGREDMFRSSLVSLNQEAVNRYGGSFGSHEDIAKNFGGFQNLASYLINGGQVRQTVNARGQNVLAPSGQVTPVASNTDPGAAGSKYGNVQGATGAGEVPIIQAGGTPPPVQPVGSNNPANSPLQGSTSNQNQPSGTTGQVGGSNTATGQTGVNSNASQGGFQGAKETPQGDQLSQSGGYYKDAQGGIFDAQGNHITPDQFTKLGLNAALIPQKDTSASGGQNTTSEIENIANKIMKDWGVTRPDPTVSPFNNVLQLAQQFMQTMGLNDIRTEYQKSQKDITDLQNKENDEINTINENPWLTEGVRETRIRDIQNRYQGKMDILLANSQRLESFNQQGTQEMQWMVGQAMTLAGQQNQTNTDLINKAIDIAEKQVAAEAKLQVPIKLSPGQTYSRYNQATGEYETIAQGAQAYGVNTQSGDIYGKYGTTGGARSTGLKGGGGGGTTSSSLKLPANATPTDITKALTSGPKIAGYDQATLYNAAIYDMLGAPTSIVGGIGSAAGRKAIGNKEAQIMQAYGLTPFDVAAAKAEYKGLTAANTKVLSASTFINIANSTATDNLNLALGTSPKIGRTDSAYINSIFQNYQSNFTAAKQLSKFEVYIYTASREYAKVTGGGAQSAQALTDSASAEASKLLNAAQSPEAFAAVVQAMKDDMANVNREYGNQLSQFAPTISKLLGMQGGGQSSQATPAPSPSPTGGSSYKGFTLPY